MKEITVEITQKCLNDCIYCSSCSNCKTYKNVIPFECLKDLFMSAKTDMDFTQLNISGGEPFVHPDIENIIMYSTSIFDDVIIYSSGLYSPSKEDNLYSPIPDRYVEICKYYKIKKVIFNMQCSSDDCHNNITGIKEKQSTRDLSIKKFIDAGIDVEINIVPMKINLDEIESTVKKAINLGCNKVNILGLVMQGRALANKDKIEMDYRDNSILNSILLDLEKRYSDKIRIGNPLQGNSSQLCTACKSRLSIRFDGTIFPCEAFKYKEKINGYEAPNIYDYNTPNFNLKNIIEQSDYFKEIERFINGCKKATCSDCPAQKDLGFKCAYNPNKETEEIDYEKNTIELFNSHMNDYLCNSKLRVESCSVSDKVKEKFLSRNYLSINKSIYDYNRNENYSLFSGDSIKMYCCKELNIDAKMYYKLLKGELSNMCSYKFIVQDSCEFVLYPEPIIIDNRTFNLLDEEKFIMSYLESATYPDKEVIKHSIAITTGNNLFENCLEKTGFKRVYGNNLFTVYAYVVPNQFCRKNILNIRGVD